MARKSIFKKSIFFSFIGHLAVFSIFSFSFGNKLCHLDYKGVTFLGSLLKKNDFSAPARKEINHPGIQSIAGRNQNIEKVFRDKNIKNLTAYNNKKENEYFFREFYLKPQMNLNVKNKEGVNLRSGISGFSLNKDSVFMFHPVFPAHFSLYFKDRQVVHIELAFNIKSEGRNKTIAVKRKISSGNLDVDLLSMRYISHFLFIQQARFAENNWQTVKIEFSPNNN